MAFIRFTGEEKVYYDSFTAPLTPEEDARQKAASDFWHDLLIEALHDLTDHVPDSELGLMLSGGGDSTAILGALLEMGRRPSVYNMHIPKNPFVPEGGLTKDQRIAQKFAEHYELPFHRVVIDDDPENMAKKMHQYAFDEPEHIDTQPDFCVAYLYEKVAEEAKRQGVTLILNGLADTGPTIPNSEIFNKRGSKGHISRSEISAFLVKGLAGIADKNQPMAFTRLIRKHVGIETVSPIIYASLLVPFLGLSFRELNRKREKWAMGRPWASYFEEAGILPFVNPMQTGDSGGTEMFKRCIASSQFAADVIGGDLQPLPLDRPLDHKEQIPAEAPSLGRFLNALKRQREEQLFADVEEEEIAHKSVNGKRVGDWPAFWAIAHGTSIEGSGFKTRFPMHSDGSLILDSDDDEGNLFEDFGITSQEPNQHNDCAELVYIDPDDPRTDAFGNRLAEGYGISDPRARAGLYTVALTPNPEDRLFVPEASSLWAVSLQGLWNEMAPHVDTEPDYHGQTIWKWLNKAIDYYNERSTLIEETERLSDRINAIESKLDTDDAAYDLPWIITDYAERVGKRIFLSAPQCAS